MPLSNTTQEVLRSNPYWDDYTRSKRFHRILVKPKTPVQTRELNQIQSMLQNQVEQLSSSIYREGAAIQGGQLTFANNAIALQIVKDVSVNIDNFYNAETTEGAIVEGITSGARAIVTQVSKTTANTSLSAILFAPLNATPFAAEESVQFLDANTGTVLATMVVGSGNTVTVSASTYSVADGVFYLRGHLVEVPKQTIILSTSTPHPSKRVGFTIAETIITSTSDGTLLDPALGSTNYAAPGADRLRLSAILTAKDINDDRVSLNADTEFIELVRIIEGQIQPQSDRLQSDFIEDTLARRTYDESGDYVVKPFRLLVKDHNPAVGVPNITGRITGNTTSTTIQAANTVTTITLANGSTSNVTTLFQSEIAVGDILVVNGEKREITAIASNTALTVNAAFFENFTNVMATVISEDKVNIELESGKAYVRGYEIGTTGTLKLETDRARTTTPVNNGKTSTGFGPSILVTKDVGLFNINQMELVHLHNVPFSSINATQSNTTIGIYPSTKIGTAFARSFVYHSGVGDANTVYRLYLVNAEFETKILQVNTTASTNDSIRLGGNSTVSAVTVNASAKTIRLRQNTAGADAAAGILPSDNSSNNAFVGATIKLFTTEGTRLIYPILASNSSGNSTTLRDHTLVLDSDDLLAKTNTTANVEIIFSDKCIRSITNAANTKTKGVTTSILSKVGYAANANTVLYNTNATSLLFRYRGGTIKPDTISDENFETIRYIASVTGSDAESAGIVKFVINSIVGLGTNEKNYTQTAGVAEYVVAARVDNGASINLTSSLASAAVNNDGTMSLYIHASGIPGYTTGIVAIALYARTSVEDGNAARAKTLYTGNTNLSSVVVNATGNLVSTANSSVGAHIGINSINTTSSRIVSLGIADVTELKKVYAVTHANTIATNASAVVDVTNNYTLDNGQRSWCYDHASIVLKPGAVHYTVNCEQLLVIADVFSHAALGSGLGYFTPESYTGYDLEDIPVFTDVKSGENFRLSSYVDFRPVRSPNFASANTATNPYTNAAAYSFPTTVLPHPLAAYQADYEYYLSRIDKVVLTKEKVFKIISGVPGDNPQAPNDDPNGITLYVLSFPAYTAFPELVHVRPFEYKRYTMKDIRTLEKRIEGLEYYAALSTMDLQALNKPELDEYDTERFKNGIVTDNFSNDAVVNFRNIDTAVSLDHEKQELRPRAVVKFYDLDPDPSATSQVVRFGPAGSGLYSLPYTSLPFLTQGLASKSININPFNVFSWFGSVSLFPSTDTWIDHITLPTLVTNMFNEHDGIRDGETIETSYNYWEKTVTGQTVDSSGFSTTQGVTGDRNTLIPEEQWAANQGRAVQVNGRIIVTTDTATTTKSTETIFTHKKVSTVETDLGERVVDQSVASFMRGIDIDISAAGLLPSAKLRALFDGIDVTSYIERANKITIALTAADSSGFEVGDNIATTAGGQGRIVAIVRDVENGVAYLYIVNATGVFAGSSIISRTNLKSLVAAGMVPAGVSISSYQHNHGKITQLTSAADTAAGPWSFKLDTGADVTGSDGYAGKVIHFTDGGEAERWSLDGSGRVIRRFASAETISTAIFASTTKQTGVAGFKAVITSYDSATRIATITALPGDSVAPFVAQKNAGLAGTAFNPIRYSIGDLESTALGNTTAIAVSPGSFFGMFRLPGVRQPMGSSDGAALSDRYDRILSGSLKFNVGSRVLRLEGVGASTDTSASTAFASKGSTIVTQRNIMRTREVDVWSTTGGIKTTSDTKTSVRSNKIVDDVRFFDPLAQTFIVDKSDYPDGIFVTHADLFFAKKGKAGMDVTAEIRTTVNGFPSADQVLARAVVTAGNIKVVPTGVTPNPGNGNHYTRFTFNQPVYLATNQEYSLVVLSNSNEYEVFVAEIGQKLIGADKIISQQPHGGVLFKSQNSRTWEPEQLEDLMFVLHRAEFETRSGNLAFQISNTNQLINNTEFDTVFVNADYLDFNSSSKFTEFSMTTTSLANVALLSSVPLRKNVDFDTRRKINEGTEGSFKLRATLRTANSHVSPIYDAERVNALFIENVIDNGKLYANGFVFTPGTPDTTLSAHYTASGNSYALTVTGGNGSNALFYAITNTSGFVTSVSLTAADKPAGNGGFGFTETPTITFANNHFTVQPTFTYNGETSASMGIIGEKKARYITRTITLADGFDAGDLKVYLSAVRAPQHNIDVYYKVLATGDTQRFEDKSWTMMELRSDLDSVYSDNLKQRKEYEYRTVANTASYTSNGVTFDRFHTFAVKLVLRSQQTANSYAAETGVVPRVSNLRILALDS